MWLEAMGIPQTFTADIAATLATITGKLASADPDAAVDRLVRFLSTADRVFERIDDSSGRLQNVYHEAAAALPDLVGRLEQADKASIPDRLTLRPAPRQCSQRRWMGGGAEAGRGAVSRQGLTHLFPRRRRLRKPRSLRISGGRTDQICDPSARQSHLAREDRLSAQTPGWSPVQ